MISHKDFGPKYLSHRQMISRKYIGPKYISPLFEIGFRFVAMTQNKQGWKPYNPLQQSRSRLTFIERKSAPVVSPAEALASSAATAVNLKAATVATVGAKPKRLASLFDPRPQSIARSRSNQLDQTSSRSTVGASQFSFVPV
ncbi:hypothetical protein BDR26DRAFT_903015 [Obelidium mucronatum]|nr:hypothetical protein BDR26DRAFT_903015 [Obelidium mucronatum]